jgi:hypothetical protein
MNEPTECSKPPTRPEALADPPSQQNPAENKEYPCSSSSTERHSRKCRICSHPKREDIEEQFTRWIRPTSIAEAYHLDGRVLIDTPND